MRAALTAILTLSIFFVAYAEGAELRELIGKLKSKDNEIRRAAARELGDLGTEAKEAVPELTKVLRDKDAFVRRFAADALGKIGPEAKSAVPALASLTNDERNEVAEAAVDALGKIGGAAVSALTSTLKDPNKASSVRRKAAVALAKVGPEARGAVPALSAVVSGKVKMAKKAKGGNDDDIRIEAATALGVVAKSSDTEAIAALKSVSEGKQRNRQLQKAASDALRRIDGMEPKKKKKG